MNKKQWLKELTFAVESDKVYYDLVDVASSWGRCAISTKLTNQQIKRYRPQDWGNYDAVTHLTKEAYAHGINFFNAIKNEDAHQALSIFYTISMGAFLIFLIKIKKINLATKSQNSIGDGGI